MPVYIIAAGDTGKVKIGWAVNARRRLAELQVAHYEPLTIIRLIDGAPEAEKSIHRRFEAQCIVREWFTFIPEMMTFQLPAYDPGRLHPLTVMALERCGNDPERYVMEFMRPGPMVAKLRVDIRKAKNAAHGPLMVQDYMRLWRGTIPWLAKLEGKSASERRKLLARAA